MVSMKHAEPMENSRKSFIQFVRNYLHPPNQACTCQLIFKRRKVQLEMKTTLALIAGKKQIHPPNCRDVQKSYMYMDALKLFILLLTQELITLIKWFWSLRYHAESAIFSTPLNRHNSKRKVQYYFPFTSEKNLESNLSDVTPGYLLLETVGLLCNCRSASGTSAGSYITWPADTMVPLQWKRKVWLYTFSQYWFSPSFMS